MPRGSDSQLFFGYPSKPELARETLSKAAELLSKQGGIEATTWEQLRVAGRVVVKRVFEAIDTATMSLFDVTTLNQNVMFEVGYATGGGKRLWLLQDTSDVEAARRFKSFGLLKGVGAKRFQGSPDIVGVFMKERPDMHESTPLIDDLLDGVEDPQAPLLYFKSPQNTDAERVITQRVERQRNEGLKCVIADARESAVEPLSWYASHCQTASAVLVHMASPRRAGAAVHNARGALVAGIAVGMQRPVLMLAEEDYAAPLDYEDLLYIYRSAGDVEDRVGPWLGRVLEEPVHEVAQRQAQATLRRRSSELGSIRLGEPVAENEADQLGEYFVPTNFFDQVLEPRTALFVGRKGTGKTATLLQAAKELGQDKRQVVSVIRPSSYDLDGVLRLLQRYDKPDSKSFLVESLWKYLFYSEIALDTQRDFLRRPSGLDPGTPEWELNSYLEGPGQVFSLDFAVRLERTVEKLLAVAPTNRIADERAQIAQALHQSILSELRRLLVAALKSKDRVAVLVDNLDQAWTTADDYTDLSFLILGLLTSAASIGADFAHAGADTKLTMAVFIRSDIFYRISVSAREPDKLPISRMSWTDGEQLLRVVEERFSTSQAADTPPSALWEKYFPQAIGGVPVRNYIAERVLPRPRDILYFCRSAIDAALRRGSPHVEAGDILMAEQSYSQNAFESLQVEMGSVFANLTEVFYEFAGSTEIVDGVDVRRALSESGVADAEMDDVLEQLRLLSFLGSEVHKDDFRFAEDPAELRMQNALATRLQASSHRGARFKVHPAFQPYLEVSSAERTGQESMEYDAQAGSADA